jgi:hypothetical protein
MRCCTFWCYPQGHLSPDAAFVYNVEQDATYYFVNVAPQFQVVLSTLLYS